MLLTPMTAGFFIRKGLHDHTADSTNKKPTLLDHMQRYYNMLITWAMQHPSKVLIAAGVILAVGIGIFTTVPQQFFPLAERDQFIMDVWLPEGSRIDAVDTAVQRIENTLRQNHEVRSYTSFFGQSSPRFYYNVNPVPTATNYAQILVNTHSIKGTTKLVKELRGQLPAIAPEAKVFVKELQQGDQMEAPVEVRIVGDDLMTLRSFGDRVQSILAHTPGASYIHSDWHEDNLLADVNLRQEVANRLGFTNSSIAQQLAGNFDGETVTTFWEGDRAIDVDLRLDPDQRQTFQNVSDTYVLSSVTGARVPVSAVASILPDWHPGRIVRRNGVRTLTLRAFPADGYLSSQVLAVAQKQIEKLPLPAGYRIEYGGEYENQDETFAEMKHALFISLIAIFLILLFQFRTLSDTLIVIAAIPLAIPGAALGLFITHNPFGFTAFIGVISLGGLVVRNSIILVDYIHERMKSGVPLDEATLEAGERRLRPIFLTTMAAAVGVTPMIISRSSLWSPLASVIAFGLVVSMFFTLIVIPVLFVVVNKKKQLNPAAAVTAAMLVLLLCSAPAHAQERTITLDEARVMAMQKNSSVLIAEQRAKQADARVTKARADYFPVVANQSYAMHTSQPEFLTVPRGSMGTYAATGPIPSSNVKIQLGEQNFGVMTTTAEQPISQMFKIHAAVRSAEAEARMAHSDLDRARNEVSLNLKKVYYGLLSTQQRKVAAERRVEAGEQQLEEMTTAAHGGVVLRAKVLQSDAEIADARNSLGTLEDDIADLQNSLNDLVGLPLSTKTQLVEPLDQTQAGEVVLTAQADLEGQALTHNPELLGAYQQLQKAHADLKEARAEYIPNISAFGQFVYQNGAPLLPQSSGAGGFRMDWTISEFGKRIGKVRERKSQVTEAQENLHATENKVRMDVESEIRKVNRCETSLEAARRYLAARTELARIASAQVEAKTANLSTLKEAQAQLAEAKAQLYNAEMNRAVAQAELARTAGHL
jgi:outer membrane protein TolC